MPAGWDATGVPEFPCCPDPQLGSLAKAGRDAADIDALIAFLQDSFTSTLYAFGHILRAHLPPRHLRLPAEMCCPYPLSGCSWWMSKAEPVTSSLSSETR